MDEDPTPVWRLGITSHGTSEWQSVIGTEGGLEHLSHRLEITNLLDKAIITWIHPAEMESSLIYGTPERGQTMEIPINNTMFTVKRLQ